MQTQPSKAEADPCNSVDRDISKVQEKFNGLRSSVVRSCGETHEKLAGIRNMLLENPEGQMSVADVFRLTGALSNVKEVAQKVATQHRDLHGAVSKVGKSIDRHFISDYGGVTGVSAFSSTERQTLLNEAIYNHFLQQGMLDIADNLAAEANLRQDPVKKQPFVELNRITEALKRREIEPALQWAHKHRDILRNKGSHLEFRLQKLKFLQLIETEGRASALHYARANFDLFAESNKRGIQELMGALVYIDYDASLGRMVSRNHHYSYLVDESVWNEVVVLFTKEAGAIQGFSVNSPLAVCVNAGCKALPNLLTIKQVMQQRLSAGVWTSKEELPIEINLGKDGEFHSLFACPILRQETTENNPPMRLTCGHAISRDALNKLANGSKLKCPYCPMEQNPSDARRVYF